MHDTKLETHNSLNKLFKKRKASKEILTIKEYALKGILKKISKDILTKDNVQKLEAYGVSLAYLASLGKNIEAVPKEFLTKEKMLQDNIGEGNALDVYTEYAMLHMLPKHLLTEDFLKYRKGPNQPNICHLIAQEGQLKNIPTSELKETHLLAHGYGKNSYHIAALQNKLKTIPEDLVTTRALLGRDSSGYNVLHILAVKKRLKDVNIKHLSEENILSQIGAGAGSTWTVAHVAANEGCLDGIPKKSLTPKVLLSTNNENKKVIELLDKPQLKSLLKSLSIKDLNTIFESVHKTGTTMLVKNEIVVEINQRNIIKKLKNEEGKGDIEI